MKCQKQYRRSCCCQRTAGGAFACHKHGTILSSRTRRRSQGCSRPGATPSPPPPPHPRPHRLALLQHSFCSIYSRLPRASSGRVQEWTARWRAKRPAEGLSCYASREWRGKSEDVGYGEGCSEGGRWRRRRRTRRMGTEIPWLDDRTAQSTDPRQGELRRTIKENMARVLRVKNSLDSRYREKLKWGRWRRRRRRRSLVLLVSWICPADFFLSLPVLFFFLILRVI